MKTKLRRNGPVSAALMNQGRGIPCGGGGGRSGQWRAWSSVWTISIGMTSTLLFPSRIGMTYELTARMKTSSPPACPPGRDSGQTIRQKVRHGEALSERAAWITSGELFESAAALDRPMNGMKKWT